METVAYQIVGWYKTMKPEYRNNTTISDGALFSDRAVAEKYAADFMVDYHIKTIKNPTAASVDHLLK